MHKENIETEGLDQLINKIKSDGVEAGEAEAKKIIAEAEEKARDILEKAKNEAETIFRETTNKIEKERDSAKQAIQLAARAVITGIKDALKNHFRQILEKECIEHLSGDKLADILSTVIRKWVENKENRGEFDIVLNEKDRKILMEGLVEKLRQEVDRGFEIKAMPNIDSGFRLYRKDGEYYYEFSGEIIAKILCEILNPEISDLLNISFNSD